MTGKRRHGPVYDDAMKVLADDDVAALLAVLGVTDVRERLTIEVTQPAMRTDLLVSAGSSRIVHVEYVTGRPADLGPRMVGYWNRIHQAHPDREIVQYVLLIGDAAVAPDPYQHSDLILTWNVIRLADLDPERLLATPTTAALAALARGDDARRVAVLRDAARRIGAVPDRDRGIGLLAAATTLASIVLSRDTIKQALEEDTMPVLFRDTPLGRDVYDEGRTEGLSEGVSKGRTAVLAELIRQRFGDDPRVDEIVGRLIDLPDRDGLARIVAATSLDDLIDPTGA